MLSKEEIEKQILNTETAKHPLLNEIYAIRDKRKETEDYTIYVDGYISVDVLNKTLELETNNKNLIEKLEEEKLKMESTYSQINGNYFMAQDRLDLINQILKIAKGEKEWEKCYL